jgi:SHS2 domain-containing protein
VGAGPHASHTFEEHTGELQIRLFAPTLAELFAEAGRALMEVMDGAPPAGPIGPGERVALSAADRDALLVDWLNELIYRVETGRRLYREFAIQQLTDEELIASIRGTPAPRLRTLVKAASFHGLRIDEADAGFTATVVLDV